MSSSRRIRFLAYALLSAGCLAAGWIQKRASGYQETRHSTKAETFIPEKPWDAPVADWPAVWKAVDSVAERELLLESWNAREPQALVHFLRRMPPLSFLNQREVEKRSLIDWGAREPQEAFEFACLHEAEYHAVGPLLQTWLNKDLDQGLALLTSRSLRQDIGLADYAWIWKDPQKACEGLCAVRDDYLRHQLLSKAAATWASRDPAAAARLAGSLHGDDIGAVLGGVVEAIPIPEAARLIETFKRKDQTTPAAAALIRRWEKEDPAAALNWAASSLSPLDEHRVLAGLGIRLAYQLKPDPAALGAMLQGLPHSSWLNLIGAGNCTIEQPVAALLIPYAPDDMVLRRLSDTLPLDPAHPPEWFTRLTPEQAAKVREWKQNR